MQIYRLRAESLTEVEELKKRLPGTRIEIMTYWDVPDVEIRFQSKLTLVDLIILMKTIEESNVMIETLAFAEEYTGDRDYGLSELDWGYYE